MAGKDIISVAFSPAFKACLPCSHFQLHLQMSILTGEEEGRLPILMSSSRGGGGGGDGSISHILITLSREAGNPQIPSKGSDGAGINFELGDGC